MKRVLLNTKLLAAALIVLGFATSTAFADDPPPAWMRQAASASIPGYDKDVPAVVLYDEEIVTVNSDGGLTTVKNYAVKLLNREGRRFAVASEVYLVNSGKVRELNAWIIRGDGTTKTYDKKSVVDMIASTADVYNERRVKYIDGTGDVDAGYVFGYSVTSEDTALFFQDSYLFQERLPELVSRYTLNLPSGWSASSVTFNSPEIKPQVNGSSYSWELRNLAPIRPEPMSPAIMNLSPRIAVNYSPSDRSSVANKVFDNWTQVSQWASAMYDPQVIVDDEVAAKARELTAGQTTELEKIRAIGAYVQNLQYISIDIGVGHGNGYRPRPSSLVLSRGYGDCKDKANLMRAMLRSLNIDAYPIAIFSGDPAFVRADWSSPSQFNHCIIAVKVSDSLESPAILKHPRLGRLLIFDATDPYTPVGDLPDYLQGSYALIIAGENGGIERMPMSPPEFDLLDRKVEATLDADGKLTGKIREETHGQISKYYRADSRANSASDFRKAIEGWLTSGATGATLVDLRSKDRVDETAFDLEVDFATPRYGQLMQNRLLVFKPVVVSRRHGVYLTESKRSSPIETNTFSMKETVIINLPAGFEVDEMPDPISLENSFAKYSTAYEVKEGKLHFTRSFSMTRALIPVEQYSVIKEFFTKMRDAEQSPVVLLRK